MFLVVTGFSLRQSFLQKYVSFSRTSETQPIQPPTFYLGVKWVCTTDIFRPSCSFQCTCSTSSSSPSTEYDAWRDRGRGVTAGESDAVEDFFVGLSNELVTGETVGPSAPDGNSSVDSVTTSGEVNDKLEIDFSLRRRRDGCNVLSTWM